jgi:hypothetical protein
MKKLLSLLLASMFFVAVNAQSNYEDIRNKMLLNQLDKAKVDLDKAFTNAKFISKPEAYILKTAIYAGLGVSEGKKNTEEGANLLKEADLAFQRFREMDPNLTLLNEPAYQNGPINLYSSFYTDGFSAYQKKNWELGLGKLKKAVEYSDILIKQKLLTSALDTNVLILAGIIAESGGYKEDAANFYGKLASAKVSGEGFESVYRFLESNAFAKKDMEAFAKYQQLGKDLYPKSDYFTFDKVDFAVGLVNSFGEKVQALDELLAVEPDNFKANEIMGEIIYDTLNPKDETAPIPANATELEKKMISSFLKAAKAKAGNEIPYLYIGDHFINKADKVNARRDAFAKEMRARTKPGVMISKEDAKKRDDLDREYLETMEGAKEPYEAAAAILAAKKELESKEKQQYKKASSYLADIYGFKKSMALKAKNAADQAKFAAEEKKWNDVYESIKN